MPSSATETKPHGGALQIEGVRRSFGSVEALKGISLEIRAGEFFSLLGPSGCGKTTLLRAIAGLDQPDGGSVRLDGENLLSSPAHERPVNTVFQSYALFPHLTVEENVGFGLRMKKVPRAEIRLRVREMMELVEVAKLAARQPHELSGGQRQRVALARALVNKPRVLLLDEPLAAVDQKLRKQLQGDLRDLQRRVGLTFVYVTHDQEEALSLSDRIAVMNHGVVEQVGAPREVYDRPRTRFAAEFLGNCNLISSEVIRPGVARTSFGDVPVPEKIPLGKQTLFFRPEKAELCDSGFPGVVEELTFTGPETHLKVRSGPNVIHIALLNRKLPELRVKSPVFWRISPDSLACF